MIAVPPSPRSLARSLLQATQSVDMTQTLNPTKLEKMSRKLEILFLECYRCLQVLGLIIHEIISYPKHIERELYMSEEFG